MAACRPEADGRKSTHPSRQNGGRTCPLLGRRPRWLDDLEGRRPVRLLADGGEPGQSDFRAFSKRERVLHIHTQVTHGILNLGV
jgi:hypothetical protein